jgi:uncharacterized protein (DUF58 family)
MISSRTQKLLDRYALASTVLSQGSGEKVAREAGQSVEFYDFRPYQPGDELRYVDWKVYARTGRLYTRLFQAERSFSLYILLDNSPSMALAGKLQFAKQLAQLLSFVSQRDSLSQVYLLSGQHNVPQQGPAKIRDTWSFIENAKTDTIQSTVSALKQFALKGKFASGSGLVLIISDLLDEASLQPVLVSMKTRGLDASFLQVMSPEDLDPEEGQLELLDVETSEKMLVTPDEVRAYKHAVQAFIERTRRAILSAGFRHSLLVSSSQDPEKQALSSLLKSGILIKR